MQQGAFPPGPMDQSFGPFEGVQMGQPMGPIYMDDHQQNNYGHQQHGVITLDPFDDSDERPKKGNSNKNKNKAGQQNKSTVDIKYEGYILERCAPLSGEKKKKGDWARVGKRAMPADEKELQQKVKRHRLKTRQSPMQDFAQMDSNQQGVVNRLILDRKQNERNPKADWILAYVSRAGKWHWTTYDVLQIRVILKRQAKDALTAKNNSTRRESKSYHEYEIIDLDDPLEKKKGKNSSKQKWDNDDYESFDDRGVGSGNKKKKGKKGGQNRNDDYGQWDDHDGWNNGGHGGGMGHHGGGGGHHGGGGGGGGGWGGNDFPGPLPPPMHHPGGFQQQQQHPHPQAIPIPPMHDQQFHGQMHGHQMPQQPFGNHGNQGLPPAPDAPLARRPSGRQAMINNPFASEHFPVHDQYDSPIMDDEDGYQGDREHRRSKSVHRRSSTRRPSVNARRFSQLEDKVDELTSTIRDLQVSSDGSSNESYGDESSYYNGRNNSTPATSHFSRRGSLDRTYGKHRPQYRSRSRRYTDAEVDIEPGYTHRSNGNGLRRYRTSGEPRGHRSGRPSVHHTHSLDDYPYGGAAKPRYLPAPPLRQLTGDYDERYDFEDRDGRPPYRRAGGSFGSFEDGYEAGRRESWGGKRHRSVGRTHWE